MSSLEIARALIGYNEWANGLLLAAADRAGSEALAKEIGAGAGTMAEGLYHVAEVQLWWFSVVDGRGDRYESPPETTALPAIEELFAASTAEMNAFAEALTEADLERAVSATRSNGEVHTWPAWQILSHLINHSTHHRAEIGRALGNLGCSPGDLDLLFYFGRS